MRTIPLVVAAVAALAAGTALSLQVTRPSSGPASERDVPRPAVAGPTPSVAPPPAAAASVMAARPVRTVAILEPKAAPAIEAASTDAPGLQSGLRPTIAADEPTAADQVAAAPDPVPVSAVSSPAATAPARIAARTAQETEKTSDELGASRSPARIEHPRPRKSRPGVVARNTTAHHANHRKTRLASNRDVARAEPAPAPAGSAAPAPTATPPRWRTLSDLFAR